MPDPIASTFLGIKVGYTLAGAIGGLLSLRYIDKLSTMGRALAIMAGASVASYVTPVVDDVFNLSTPSESAVAFFLGLTAMNIIPGVLKLSEMFSQDPLRFLRAVQLRKVPQNEDRD